MSDLAFDTNTLKGIGTASKAVGRFIEGIPLIKESPAGEFLQDSGFYLEKKSIQIQKRTVDGFSFLRIPGTEVFVKQIDDFVRIYNRTTQIFFDENKIYLTDN